MLPCTPITASKPERGSQRQQGLGSLICLSRAAGGCWSGGVRSLVALSVLSWVR